VNEFHISYLLALISTYRDMLSHSWWYADIKSRFWLLWHSL